MILVIYLELDRVRLKDMPTRFYAATPNPQSN